MKEDIIKIAIAGVGNIASGLLQGITYFKNFEDKKKKLLHPNISSYEVKNIQIVAAFDVDENKVGKDLSEAIFAPINSTPKFVNVDETAVLVQKGPLKDGLSGYLQEVIKVSKEVEVNVTEKLKESGAEMFICALPIHSPGDKSKWHSLLSQEFRRIQYIRDWTFLCRKYL